jgi:plasmid stabilization system protein ParE
MSTKYQLEYLPLFYEDLEQVVDYISCQLGSPQAAENLINEVEQAIRTRLLNPEGYEPYNSSKRRKHSYYRIYVKNFTVFYVLIDNVMEVRRFIYSKRNLNRLIS